MNPNHLTSAMIDKIVERKIEDMAKDPKATIRQLMNYFYRFSSSRFQTPIFTILQHLLANDDSQYYIMIQNLLQNVSHSAIKNLGINLGYNSWTRGAQTVRSAMQKAGYCIPWILIFRWNPAKTNTVNLKNMNRFIRDANKLGIYAFCIRQEIPHQSFGEIFELFDKHSDSTFFWFLPNQMLAPIHLDMIRKCENVLALFDSDESYTYRNVSLLKERKALYGIYHTYTSLQTFDNSNQWMDYYKMYETPFVFMIPDDSCSQEDQDAVSVYIEEVRAAQQYPFYIFDFYRDIQAINEAISGSDCYMDIGSDGQLIYPKTTQIFFHDSRLIGYLAASMPATARTPKQKDWNPNPEF